MKNNNTKNNLLCNFHLNNSIFNLYSSFKNLSLEETNLKNSRIENKLLLRKNKIDQILLNKRLILNNGCV